MEQVAHQTIVMQFILELAKSLKVDPRGCFRQFFEKIKVIVWWLENNHSFKVQVEYRHASVEQGDGLGLESFRAIQVLTKFPVFLSLYKYSSEYLRSCLCLTVVTNVVN